MEPLRVWVLHFRGNKLIPLQTRESSFKRTLSFAHCYMDLIGLQDSTLLMYKNVQKLCIARRLELQKDDK